jgi:hypothetical protein
MLICLPSPGPAFGLFGLGGKPCPPCTFKILLSILTPTSLSIFIRPCLLDLGESKRSISLEGAEQDSKGCENKV